MTWIDLNSEKSLQDLLAGSILRPQVIFKHSTRCATSGMAKNRLERAEPPPGVDFHFLDLIRYRSLSNQVAEQFRVWHESPQVLLIVNRECIYEESHSGISMDELREQLPSGT
jgi:bacillithiol system protein YtxJ